jgi:hypothetical protein
MSLFQLKRIFKRETVIFRQQRAIDSLKRELLALPTVVGETGSPYISVQQGESPPVQYKRVKVT